MRIILVTLTALLLAGCASLNDVTAQPAYEELTFSLAICTPPGCGTFSAWAGRETIGQ